MELRDEKGSWHQLSPWEHLAAKDFGPESGSLCIVQMIILFPGSCVAWVAWSCYLSININHTTQPYSRGLLVQDPGVAYVCVYGITISSGCQTDFFSPIKPSCCACGRHITSANWKSINQLKVFVSTNGLCVLGLIRLVVAVNAVIRPFLLCFHKAVFLIWRIWSRQKAICSGLEVN